MSRARYSFSFRGWEVSAVYAAVEPRESGPGTVTGVDPDARRQTGWATSTLPLVGAFPGTCLRPNHRVGAGAVTTRPLSVEAGNRDRCVSPAPRGVLPCSQVILTLLAHTREQSRPRGVEHPHLVVADGTSRDGTHSPPPDACRRYTGEGDEDLEAPIRCHCSGERIRSLAFRPRYLDNVTRDWTLLPDSTDTLLRAGEVRLEMTESPEGAPIATQTRVPPETCVDTDQQDGDDNTTAAIPTATRVPR